MTPRLLYVLFAVLTASTTNSALAAGENFNISCPLNGADENGTPVTSFTRVYSLDFGKMKFCDQDPGGCTIVSDFRISGNKVLLEERTGDDFIDLQYEFDLETNFLTEATYEHGKLSASAAGVCQHKPFTPLVRKQ
jgi:hypothetical protein